MNTSTNPLPVQTPGADRPVENPPQPNPEQRAQPPTRPPVPGLPAPEPPVPFAPRGRNPGPARQTAPGISSMLDMVAYAPWSKPESLALSTFIPCAHVLFYCLHECDTLMLSTDRFNRGHPQWLPYVSRLYISVLFYFRIMDCMVLSGDAGTEIINLLNEMKSRHDFRRLMIPGPLVPIFQSLSVCASGNELLGDVSPTLPGLGHATGQLFYNLSNPAVPNTLALMDDLHAAIESGRTTTAANEYDPVHHTSYSLHREPVTDATYQAIRSATAGPGFHTTSHLTHHELQLTYRARSRLTLPPQIRQVSHATSRVACSWRQFLRMEPVPGEATDPTFRQWFTQVSRVMAEYSAYFRESTSLGSIPIASGAAPHVQLAYEHPTHTAHPFTSHTYVRASGTTPAHLELSTLATLDATAKVVAPGVTDLHIQVGTLSQTNAWSASLTSTPKVGPAWSQSPATAELSRFDIFHNVPTYVSALHVSRALE